MEIKEKCPAKINLFLRVKEKKDGYHQIETLMAPLDLCDYIIIRKSDRFIYETQIENDIVLKALNLFFEKYQIKDSNIEIILEKNIPLAAGLAGGSADCAGVLRALNKYYDLKIELKELEEICNKLGSDISYCLYNQMAYCTNRGEVVEILPKLDIEIPLLLLKPEFGLSTKEVYQNYEFIRHDYNKELFIETLKKKDISKLNSLIFNDLENASLKISEELRKIVKEYSNLGLVCHQSGSGPTYFSFDIDKKYIISDKMPHIKTFSAKIYL